MLKGKKICVTGGAGFLGSHLLPRLAAAGAETTCLARPGKKRDIPPQTRLVYGDCASGAGLEEAFAGQDIVIHLAASLFGHGWRGYLEANAAGAHHVARALAAQKKRPALIHVSSLACAGPCATMPGKDENWPPAPVSAYGWSKYISEQTFRAAGLERLVILRPPIIYGSGDMGLLPVFRGVKRGIGVSPGFGRQFPVSIIHATDMALAIVLAAASNASGIFHLSDGQAHDMTSICAAMARAMGRPAPFMAKPPLWLMGFSAALATAFGAAISGFAGLCGLKQPAPPRWNLDKYREARQAGWLANDARIRKELGFEPMITLEEGMAEAVAGYRARGLL